MNLPIRTMFDDVSSFIQSQSVTWPVMPEAGQALIRTFNNDDVDTYTVCRIIKKDPTLTATLLRMANSAMFGLSGSIDTLERAVSVVGLSMVRARALSACMVRVCVLPIGMDRMEFWRYCMLCAGYAQWIADLCDVDDQEAWLCGMMLRLGEITLGQARPACLPHIEAKPVAPMERWLRERSLIGFDEGEVTAALAQQWDFPDSLVSGLRYCSQPLTGNTFSKLAAVLHLAARLADGGPVTPDALQNLPLLVLQWLHLELQMMSTQIPDHQALSDVSMFQNSVR